MKLVVMKNHEELSKHACELIINKVNSLSSPVLGLATGSTPERLYEMMIDKYNQKVVSFSHVKTFNLDEYVGLSENDTKSYRYYMNHHLFSQVNFTKGQNHIPNGMASHLEQECQRYEQLIADACHIDLQILGLGHNGHIGFNEPGTSFSTRTHVVDLERSTREANARFFESIKEVPTQAITMGIETILQSKQIILLVSGEQKAKALHRLLNGEVSEDFPASVLKRHHDVTIIADEAALQL
ncbi:glucosamine-6-phosphate deaminase [Alkalihalobacterium elongatum]|uniref:glucosamine-6-phosphate deaminase n=1 Tax=Alkalihalobacterium elongatum TaxID=2675466 RepID=UPI001C1FDDFB|nr:glucosamine-6-phosphate deaminase [Alkalihalobacterium elongatum]